MEDRLFRAGPGCVYKVEYRSGKEIGGPLSSEARQFPIRLWQRLQSGAPGQGKKLEVL